MSYARYAPSTAIQNAALDLFIVLVAPIVNATDAKKIRVPSVRFHSCAKNAGNLIAKVARRHVPEIAEPSDARSRNVLIYL